MSDQDADNFSENQEDSPPKEGAAIGGPAPKKKSRRGREKVSWVWEYFIKEDHIAVCQFCQAGFTFSSTTTLSYHLNHVHKNLVNDKTILTPKQQMLQQSQQISITQSKNTNVSKSSLPSIFSEETTVLISKVLGQSSDNVRAGKANQNENKNKKLSKDHAESPNRKAKRRREKVSWVWQYFVKDGKTAICQFCDSSFSTASTTTLGYHLNNVHKDLVNDGTSFVTVELNDDDESEATQHIRMEVTTMPHLKITTNISERSIPNAFLKDSSALMSSMLGQPESQCVVTVIPDRMMLWGGKEGPCAIISLNSIGEFSEDQSKDYSKLLVDHIKKHLGVAANRMCIRYKNS